MAQLSCKNISLGYKNNVVLENVSFSINKGDYLCIIGENGAGKTTLMRSILGILQPIKGKFDWSEGLSVGHVGYLTQSSDAQKDFPASVREVVMSGFQKKMGLLPFYTKQQKQEAKDTMCRMGIDSFQKKCFRELSGGQQQRVLLTRALCATHKMLFLDEPVAGLDSKAGQEMYNIVDEINKKDDVTILMISHNLDDVIGYASHILVIGKQMFFGTKDEYLQHLEQIKNKVGEANG